jgi:hypothetical protein
MCRGERLEFAGDQGWYAYVAARKAEKERPARVVNVRDAWHFPFAGPGRTEGEKRPSPRISGGIDARDGELEGASRHGRLRSVMR